MPGYPWLYDDRARYVSHRRQDHHAAAARRALSRRATSARRQAICACRRRDRRRPATEPGSRRPGRSRDRRAHRLSAAARHRHQGDAGRRRGDGGAAGGGRPVMYMEILRAHCRHRHLSGRLAAAVRRRSSPSSWSRCPRWTARGCGSRRLPLDGGRRAVRAERWTQDRSDAQALTSCSITKPTAFASSTTRCRAGGCMASTSRSLFAVGYLVNYHVLPEPLFGQASMIAEYQAELARGRRRPRRAGGQPRRRCRR